MSAETTTAGWLTPELSPWLQAPARPDSPAELRPVPSEESRRATEPESVPVEMPPRWSGPRAVAPDQRPSIQRGERPASRALAALPAPAPGTALVERPAAAPAGPDLAHCGVSTEPVTIDPAPTRRNGWWRRVRSAMQSPAEDITVPRLDIAALRSLRRPLAPAVAPYVVSAMSLKGGVGKTTVAASLGLMLARHRADRVLAADLNMHAGTLVDRLITSAPRATVQHLLDDLLEDELSVSAIGDIDRYLEVADRLSVLSGHKDPTIGAAFAEDDIAELLRCLGRFFHLVMADCGTGIADDTMQAVLRETNTLVLVATPTPDAAGLAEDTLGWLDSHGYPGLVKNSIAVLSGPASGDRAGLRARFHDRCRAVIDIPADSHLASGQVISLEAMAPETRQAYLYLAAAVMDAAPEPTDPARGDR